MINKLLIISLFLSGVGVFAQQRPNVVLIYADDLGYGDLSCYGATKVKTPNIDRLASQGLRFKNAYATAATCTPSRYSLMTGEYAWRQKGTGIAPGNASLIIKPGRSTLPGVFKSAGYQTGAVGKWHLGLGGPEGPNWNGEVKPGPLELGFTNSYIMAATGDRVPCVYVENHRVVNLDPKDPIQVDYKQKIGDWPTGSENPEKLKMKHSHGHDMTIVNGVGRIGWMTGGKAALWKDEDMADVFTSQAVKFIEANQKKPFFLFFATHDVHVPRVPHPRFVGKSGLGARGDALLEFDWEVGEVLKTLDRLGLANNTIVMLSSDNGPVVDDGYQDQAVEKLGGHKPAGPLRGGKYSAFEAGTRVPLLIRWPGQVKVGVSEAPISQVDFLADFATLLGQTFNQADSPDSENQLNALLGHDPTGRSVIVEHAGTLSIVQKKPGEARWKYIEPSNGESYSKNTNTELGNNPKPQLYNLTDDIGEKKNVADLHPDRVQQMKQQLDKIRNKKAQ
ncbi:arylsulfatase [Spirosoma sp. BT702]|uniref:Arylsulfatase n=1 Tax=Spirosoma profusum TaxID=2771354 RepID=A0A927ASJ1_9BACT|nr:arylsulfatase [Spirosoma profusum]MBD2701355.1 arylsulfatase [Spirosoma profusum]